VNFGGVLSALKTETDRRGGCYSERIRWREVVVPTYDLTLRHEIPRLCVPAPFSLLVSLKFCRNGIHYNGSLESVSVQIKCRDLKSQRNAKCNNKEWLY
jgi:hypothetical protein